jgi:TolB-like protein
VADVFVSYVRENRAIAEKIAGGLSDAGFSVWWDRHIRGGAKFAMEIERELKSSKVVVVLWSTASLGSEWVRDEAEQARNENKLIPVCLDEVQPPLGFRQSQALNFGSWRGDAGGEAFAGLVASVRHFVGNAANTPTGEAATSNEPLRDRWPASKRALVFGGLAMAVAAVALSMFWPHFGPRDSSDDHDGRIEIGAFEPLAQSEELDQFAKGITATVVRVFATNGIRTVVRNPTDAEVLVASATTGPEFALRGRVDRDGDDLVASADIVNRRDGLVLWSLTKRRNAAQRGILQEQFSASLAIVLRLGLRSRTLSNKDPSTDLLAQYLRLWEMTRDNQWEQTPELAAGIVEAAPQHAFSYAMQASMNALLTVIPTSTGARRPPDEIARLRKVVYDSAAIAAKMDPRIDSWYARAVVVDPAVGLGEREQLLRRSLDLDLHRRTRRPRESPGERRPHTRGAH